MTVYSTYHLVMAVVFAILGAVLTIIEQSFGLQLFYAIFYSLMMLWFLHSAFKKNLVKQGDRIALRNHTCIADYNEGLRQLNELLNECKCDSFEQRMLESNIWLLQLKRDNARAQDLPYAMPGHMDQALADLNLTRHKASLDDDKIRDAANKIRRDNDPEALKKRNAPKGVLKTARRRRKAAEQAERLLLGRPKTFTSW